MTNNTPASEVPWTPGPWRESYCGADTSEIIASDGLVVAAVWDRGSSSLIAESPTMAALLEAIDKSWTEYWPDGPDSKSTNEKPIVCIAEETVVIWRGIRESLARIRSVK